MPAPTSTGWRVFRASVFAVLATQLAALGHVLGGGGLPDPALLLTVAVFLGGALSGLATRRRSGPQIFAMMALSQFVFHAVFEATAHADHVGGGLVGWDRMVVFHLVAATATSCLLAGGENALFRLFGVLRRLVVVVRPVAVVGFAPAWTVVLTGGAGAARLRAGELLRISRRGPPHAA